MTVIRPEPFRALRHLALVYSVNRPVSLDAVQDALAAAAVTGATHLEPFTPLGQTGADLPAGEQQWQYAFHRTDLWLDQIELALGQTGAQPTIHVFARAPIPLLLSLGMRLDRHRVIAYQEDRDSGAWRPASDSAAMPAGPFFTVTGLPEAPARGRGDVLLAIEVTHEISDLALRTLSADPSPLAEVRLRAAAGAGHAALQDPAQATAAAAQLRQVLDQLHRELPGADAVRLGAAVPAALALALGRAVTPRAQHPLVLHNYRDNRYTAVHRIEARPASRPAAPPTDSDRQRAAASAERVAAVHRDLAAWLKAQGPLADRFGGARFTEAVVSPTPAAGPSEFDFAYLDGQGEGRAELRLGAPLLLMLDDLARTGLPPADLDELLRLFLLHEGHHLRQGLTTYGFADIGRSSVVLEAIDYDADALAIAACLRRRTAQDPDLAPMSAVVPILECVLHGLVGFDQVAGRVPLVRLPERRLRRYLLWYLQLARARAAGQGALFSDLRLHDRPAVEVRGVATAVEAHGRHVQLTVDLGAVGGSDAPGLDIYLGGVLHREPDTARCGAVLAALRDGRREDVVRGLHAIFERAPHLVPAPAAAR